MPRPRSRIVRVRLADSPSDVAGGRRDGGVRRTLDRAVRQPGLACAGTADRGALVIRAVLFDLDGTLYRQAPMRLLMAGELATVPWMRRHPRGVPRLWKQLRAFREAREALRALGRPAELLERLQYSVPAERSGMPPTEIEEAVAEWMFQRPLKYLRHVARPGLHELFERLDAQGLKIGVFSDYPVRDKLEALEVAARVSLMLEATAPEINAFKPHPQGFSRACGRWALDPHEVLYVGDRAGGRRRRRGPGRHAVRDYRRCLDCRTRRAFHPASTRWHRCLVSSRHLQRARSHSCEQPLADDLALHPDRAGRSLVQERVHGARRGAGVLLPARAGRRGPA